MSNRKCKIKTPTHNKLTHESHNQELKKDPESVTKYVHEDDGDKCDGEVGLTLSLLVLFPTEYLK